MCAFLSMCVFVRMYLLLFLFAPLKMDMRVAVSVVTQMLIEIGSFFFYAYGKRPSF